MNDIIRELDDQNRAELDEPIAYAVWHAQHPSFCDFLLTAEDAPAFPADFTLVALVAARGLDEVYQQTNHIDRPWPENPGVTVYVDAASVRSTSVGDVIGNPLTGEAFVVRSVGFSKLPVGVAYSIRALQLWRQQELDARRPHSLLDAQYAFAVAGSDRAPRRRWVARYEEAGQ